MIVSDKYVFIHLQKTGGTYLSDFLCNYGKGKHVGGKHATINHILPKDNNKLKFAVIRNPYDWYVSHYHFQMQNNGHLINHLNRPQTFGEYLNVLFRYDNKRKKLFKKELPKIDYENFVNLEIGMLTYRYINFFCSDFENVLNTSTKKTLVKNIENNLSIDKVIKLENLCEDVSELFNKLDINLNDIGREEICSGKKSNTSKHKNYVEYYKNNDLCNIITSRDSYLIDKYGYKL